MIVKVFLISLWLSIIYEYTYCTHTVCALNCYISTYASSNYYELQTRELLNRQVGYNMLCIGNFMRQR